MMGSAGLKRAQPATIEVGAAVRVPGGLQTPASFLQAGSKGLWNRKVGRALHAGDNSEVLITLPFVRLMRRGIKRRRVFHVKICS